MASEVYRKGGHGIFCRLLVRVGKPMLIVGRRHPLSDIAHVAAFTSFLICFLWPAIDNGGPLLDSDTPAYIRYADVAIAKITGHPSEWSQVRQAIETGPVASQPAGGDSTGNGRAPYLGRYIYYGALLKLGDFYAMMTAGCGNAGGAIRSSRSCKSSRTRP